MNALKGTILKIGADQPIASAELIAFAQKQVEAKAHAELDEQRFRRLADGKGPQIWVDLEVQPVGATGTLTRISMFRGTSQRSKRGTTKIAEYEEIWTDSSAAVTEQRNEVALERDTHKAVPEATSATQSTADIRRQQIVEGACEVISRKGYAEASVREIAEAAGVSIPSLYQYVDSKEDILFLITEGCMQRLFNDFRETTEAALSADAKIEKAIADYLAYISDNRRYINLVYRETRSLSPENRERIFDIERALMKEWEKIVRAGIRSGHFRKFDSSLVSNILYFACSVWALRHWAIGEHGEDKIRAMLTELMLDGLRK